MDRGRWVRYSFLRLCTPFHVAGLGRWPYSVAANHRSGRILIRSRLSSHSLGFVTVHGKGVLSRLVETEMVLPLSNPNCHSDQGWGLVSHGWLGTLDDVRWAQVLYIGVAIGVGVRAQVQVRIWIRVRVRFRVSVRVRV